MNVATGIGLAGAGLGVLSAVFGNRKLAVGAAAAAAAAAVMAQRNTEDRHHLERRISAMHDQIRQLEAAVASQVQGRMTAEEAVRSLSNQLSDAERRAEHVNPAPLVISDDGSVNEGLTDPTTGLFNHQYFLVALESRIAAARRHLRPVAACLIEVVDGREGDDRPPADAMIVADALRDTLRESDTATRLSDGRFGVVLEDTPENGAIWTMERIRRRLVEASPDITMWAGISCYPAHAFDVANLIDRGEVALAAAKEWHQDRIEVATAE